MVNQDAHIKVIFSLQDKLQVGAFLQLPVSSQQMQVKTGGSFFLSAVQSNMNNCNLQIRGK